MSEYSTHAKVLITQHPLVKLATIFQKAPKKWQAKMMTSLWFNDPFL